MGTFRILLVIAQPIANNDLRGFKAIRIDSKAEKPFLFPVLTIERTAANKSRPQSERKPFVTFLKMTLQRKACSLELLVGGIVESHSLKIGAYYEGEERRSWKTPTVQRLSTSIQGMLLSFAPKN